MTATAIEEIVHPAAGRTRGRYLRQPMAVFGLTLVLGVAALAVFAPWIARSGPTAQDLSVVYQGPSSDHWLGTDALGRDQLSRVLFGARLSLLAALEAVGIAALLGVPAGMYAGFRGGLVDTALSRINDVIMSVPGLVLALTVVAVLGPGLGKAMLAVGVIIAPMLFRVSRAGALDVRQNMFIEGSVAIGCTRSQVMWRHVFPNAFPPVLTQISFLLGYAVLAEASLSFLGLGAQPPAASWGSMLTGASARLDLPYLLYGPGLALMITVLAFTLLGDALQEAFSVARKR